VRGDRGKQAFRQKISACFAVLQERNADFVLDFTRHNSHAGGKPGLWFLRIADLTI